jgi:ubiquinone/menaquinone biosynthesis C-methylase UbiE
MLQTEERRHLVGEGAGAGRWSKLLQPVAARLILVDVAERCLDLCRERFRDRDNVEYHLVDGAAGSFIPPPVVRDDSVDCVWSYDVFVHINATDTDRYLSDLRRISNPAATP